jgi:hypothetical protein
MNLPNWGSKGKFFCLIYLFFCVENLGFGIFILIQGSLWCSHGGCS